MRIRVPDDMSPGDWIARYRPTGRRRRRGRFVIDDEGNGVRVGCDEDAAGIPEGVPLKVLGLSLPYVVCSVLQPGGEEHGPTILDVRETRFVRLDPAYVEAIARFSRPEPPATDDAVDVDDVPF